MKTSTVMPSRALELGLGRIVATAAASFALLAATWAAVGNHRRFAVTVRLSDRSPRCRHGSQAYYFEDSGDAAFDETPREWRLRPFDSACEPRDLVTMLLNATGSGQDDDGGGGCDTQLVIALYGDRWTPGLLSTIAVSRAFPERLFHQLFHSQLTAARS
jgi:hypothetical protein